MLKHGRSNDKFCHRYCFRILNVLKAKLKQQHDQLTMPYEYIKQTNLLTLKKAKH